MGWRYGDTQGGPAGLFGRGQTAGIHLIWLAGWVLMRDNEELLYRTLVWLTGAVPSHVSSTSISLSFVVRLSAIFSLPFLLSISSAVFPVLPPAVLSSPYPLLSSRLLPLLCPSSS